MKAELWFCSCCLASKEAAAVEKIFSSLSKARDMRTKTHFPLVINVVHLTKRMKSPDCPTSGTTGQPPVCQPVMQPIPLLERKLLRGLDVGVWQETGWSRRGRQGDQLRIICINASQVHK